MHIGFFMTNYWSGGLETFAGELINNWPGKKDTITIFCNHESPGLKVLRERITRECEIVAYRCPTISSYKVQRLKAEGKKFKYLIVRAAGVFGRYFLMIYQVLFLCHLFKKYGIDKIFISTGGYPGSYVCRSAALLGLGRKRNKKPAMIIHNYPENKPICYLRTIEYFLDYLIIKSVGKMIFVSRHTRDECQKFRPILTGHKNTSVIYYGENFIQYEYDNPLLENLGVPDGCKVLLMGGTFEPRKGHIWLFEALTEVLKYRDDLRLLVCGEGDASDRRRLLEKIDELNLKDYVIFLGFRKDFVRIMRQADILVFPSLYGESFGLVILEAWSQKKPVIAGRTGGIPEVIDDQVNGVLVNAGDVSLLAKAIIDVLDDPNTRQDMGHRGYQKLLEKFTVERMAQDYYKMLLDSGDFKA